MTIEQLKEHMHRYNDATIIIGPDAVKELKQFGSGVDEVAKRFTIEEFKRNPDKFWKYFKKEVFRSPEEFQPTRAQRLAVALKESGLASSIVDLNVDGLMPLDGNTGMHLHGHDLLYKCVNEKCYGIVYPWQYVFESEDPDSNTCEICGHILKPDVKLIGEDYDEDKYKVAKHLIESTHTLITIGLDYTETAIVEMIADYGDQKGLCALEMATGKSMERKVLVAIHDDRDSAQINDITTHEFMADGDAGVCLARLLDALEVHHG